MKYITDYLKDNAAKCPDKLALITDARSLSWAELWREVQSRSGYFAKAGEKTKQTVFGILMPNGWEFVVTYLAILEAGHIAAPIDVIYKPLEINSIIDQLKPVITITDEANYSRVSGAKKAKFTDVQHDLDFAGYRQAPDRQIATLVFTSGTTGKPKAAPHTHANHIWNIVACSRVWGWDSDDIQLLSLRLSHWYGLCMGISGAIYHANTTYLTDGFNALKTLEMLSSGKVSLFTHTPIAYKNMLEVLGNYDLSGVKLLISGSAPLAPVMWKEFYERFGKKVIETYGSSETGRIAANLPDNPRPGTPGKILDDVAVKISKGNELWVKSPGLFPGYYDNEPATKKMLDSDGYFRTGDIAQIKDDYLILKGRTHETIRKYGYTLSPRDIEWALGHISSITESAVMGKKADGEDDKIIYFIAGEVSDEELSTFQKQEMPSIWRADKIVRLDRLPRTAMGKVNIKALAAMLD